MNWTYSIAFDIAGIGQVSAAEQAVDGLDSAVENVGNSAAVSSGKFSEMGNKGQSSFSKMRSGALRFLATLGLVAATLGSITTAASDDATNIAIDFATSGNGAENLAFIDQTADKLGLNLVASKDGFKQLAGSLRGTNLEGKATQDIFYGVAAAGGAMRLSADQIKGAYLAVGQIASKGKVQAEELRGQLGERIPGAFKIAADAMGVTQAKLNKMLETGQVAADDFLPKFGAQLNKVFGEDAMRVAEGPAAAMERYRNSVYRLQVAFGTELLPAVMTLLEGYLIPAISYVSEHIELFVGLAASLTGFYVAVKSVTLISQAATAAQWLWNVALMANPIGLVIGALVALGIAVVYAWNKFAGFRGFIYGMFAAITEYKMIIYDYLITPFLSLGKVVAGIFTFDANLIASGIADGVKAVEKMTEGAGSRLSNAFNTGWKKGEASLVSEKDIPGKGILDATSNAFAGGSNTPDNAPTDSANGNTTAGLSGITGRGSTKNITINMNAGLVQELQIIARNVEEGTDEMVDMVSRKLLQVLNNANQAQ